ncbi:unnamed protein product [Ectocarpus sp. CCAP 1310/34]|nr:unnamed protein product [Ectocarpus sp. CCAP 1310/34]
MRLRVNNGSSPLPSRTGASLEAVNKRHCCTPLHLAAQRAQWKAMLALIEAGANVNSRMLDGATLMLIASTQGYKDAIPVLLRAKADPQLQHNTSGNLVVPSDTSAIRGDSDAVRELIRHVGIEGCGGPSRGIWAHGLVYTPMEIAMRRILRKKVEGKEDINDEQLRSVEAIRRLLLQVEAIRAIACLWPGNNPSVAHAAAEGTGRTSRARPRLM